MYVCLEESCFAWHSLCFRCVWGSLTWFGCEGIAKGDKGVNTTYRCILCFAVLHKHWPGVTLSVGIAFKRQCAKQRYSRPHPLETLTAWRRSRGEGARLHIFVTPLRTDESHISLNIRHLALIRNFSFTRVYCLTACSSKRRNSKTNSCVLSGKRMYDPEKGNMDIK
jgi:hypothetical protein